MGYYGSWLKGKELFVRTFNKIVKFVTVFIRLLWNFVKVVLYCQFMMVTLKGVDETRTNVGLDFPKDEVPCTESQIAFVIRESLRVRFQVHLVT